MVELLRRRAGPVVRVRRDEEADVDAAAGRAFDAPDHPAVRDVRVDDVERLPGAVEQARDGVGDRAVAARRVVEDDRGDVAGALVREQRFDPVRLPAQPAQARDEDELELRHDRPGDPDEQVVEAPVLEVILDPRAADPADPAVHDDDLAMVDVPEAREIPVQGAASAERAGRRPGLRRPHDADLGSGRGQLVVELLRAALGVGALAVDDEPDRHAVSRLGEERLGEPVPHRSRTEAELVDVDRRRSRSDVLEHPRVEVRALDEDLRRGGGALVERQREIGTRHRPAHEALRVAPQLVVADPDHALSASAIASASHGGTRVGRWSPTVTHACVVQPSATRSPSRSTR